MIEIQDKQQESVAAYLDGPKKKQKNYILFACSSAVPEELKTKIEGYIRKNHSSLFITRPKNAEDLLKNIKRTINLIVVDDEFLDLKSCLTIIKTIKQKKHNVDVPVLFLTRNNKLLIDAYHEELSIYQECDDYINYTRQSSDHVLNKIKTIMSGGLNRRSRRYVSNIPVAYEQLRYNRKGKGRIVDISLHGALIIGEDDKIFEPDEQLRVSLPLLNYGEPGGGDYLNISCKVRRIFISGTKAGVSFEYMTEEKVIRLSQFLVNYAAKHTKLNMKKIGTGA